MTWSLKQLEPYLMLAVGLICLALWRSLGRQAHEYHRRHFKVRSSVHVYQAAYLIAGVLFVLLSALEALDVVHFGP